MHGRKRKAIRCLRGCRRMHKVYPGLGPINVSSRLHLFCAVTISAGQPAVRRGRLAMLLEARGDHIIEARMERPGPHIKFQGRADHHTTMPLLPVPCQTLQRFLPQQSRQHRLRRIDPMPAAIPPAASRPGTTNTRSLATSLRIRCNAVTRQRRQQRQRMAGTDSRTQCMQQKRQQGIARASACRRNQMPRPRACPFAPRSQFHPLEYRFRDDLDDQHDIAPEPRQVNHIRRLSSARTMRSPMYCGEATRNIPGNPYVIAVSTKPGLTVMTRTPLGYRRLRSPCR